MIWDSKFPNVKIRGTGDESPKNQWTAAEASFPSSTDDPAAAVDSRKKQCNNVANSKIHGTVNNQWTAASALMVVEVFGVDGNDASPRKASVPSARDDPATAVYSKTSKNQCTNVIISKNQGTVSGFPKKQWTTTVVDSENYKNQQTGVLNSKTRGLRRNLHKTRGVGTRIVKIIRQAKKIRKPQFHL